MLRGLRKKLQAFEILPNSDKIYKKIFAKTWTMFFAKKGQLSEWSRKNPKVGEK